MFDWEDLENKTDDSVEFRFVKSEKETIMYDYSYNKCPAVKN